MKIFFLRYTAFIIVLSVVGSLCGSLSYIILQTKYYDSPPVIETGQEAQLKLTPEAIAAFSSNIILGNK